LKCILACTSNYPPEAIHREKKIGVFYRRFNGDIAAILDLRHKDYR